MSLKVKENVKYAVACPTSMGVRITPENRMAVQNSHMFYMQATSAETNVLNVSSSLGKKCLALTRFVEGSPVAKFIQQDEGVGLCRINCLCNIFHMAAEGRKALVQRLVIADVCKYI